MLCKVVSGKHGDGSLILTIYLRLIPKNIDITTIETEFKPDDLGLYACPGVSTEGNSDFVIEKLAPNDLVWFCDVK